MVLNDDYSACCNLSVVHCSSRLAVEVKVGSMPSTKRVRNESIKQLVVEYSDLENKCCEGPVRGAFRTFKQGVWT